MSIEEIASLIAQRLLQGAMNHEQFCNYYHFLGLQGYKAFHECHFYEQNDGYRKFVSYFMSHYNRFIPKFSIQTLSSSTFSIVPDNWYGYSREDADMSTRRNAVKSGLEKYVRWQQDTKKFFEDMYTQTINAGEISMAIEIKKYLKSVNYQIVQAEKELLEIKSTDYDLPTVISKQPYLCHKYNKKINKMRKELDHDKSSLD